MLLWEMANTAGDAPAAQRNNMHKFSLQHNGTSIADIDLEENLADCTVSGTAKTVVEQHLTQPQPIWVGDVENGENLVVEKPTSDPSLLQRMLMQLPALLSPFYGNLEMVGDWEVFTK